MVNLCPLGKLQFIRRPKIKNSPIFIWEKYPVGYLRYPTGCQGHPVFPSKCPTQRDDGSPREPSFGAACPSTGSAAFGIHYFKWGYIVNNIVIYLHPTRKRSLQTSYGSSEPWRCPKRFSAVRRMDTSTKTFSSELL